MTAPEIKVEVVGSLENVHAFKKVLQRRDIWFQTDDDNLQLFYVRSKPRKLFRLAKNCSIEIRKFKEG